MIKLTITESKSDKYYYAQMSVRNGKKVRSETVEKIGKHSELLNITDDPEAYANAIVEKLDNEYRNAKAPLVYNVDFSKKIPIAQICHTPQLHVDRMDRRLCQLDDFLFFLLASFRYSSVMPSVN